jgi:tape measure domain-containing protein
MPELATAWVTLTASTRGMETDIKQALNRAERSGTQAGRGIGKNVAQGLSASAGDIESRASQIGERIGTVIAKPVGLAITGLKAGVGAAAVGVGAVMATALAKGFERLKTIDDAKFKLKALGNSAADVQKIMDSALESVKGTAFGLGDAATIAANAVAAGVQPGKDLTEYLKMTADASAIAGTSLSDMGRIINQVRTGQKAYTEDLNQLADRGIPIYQWLAEEAGVAAGDVKKLAAEGGISAQMFEAAIKKHIGGAALTMGQSFSGAVQNAEAALGRLGAAFLKPVFGNFAGGIGSITDGLDSITAWIDAHQGDIVTFWESFGDLAITAAENVAHGVGGMLQAFGDMIGGVGNVKGVLDDLMGDFATLRGDDAAATAFHASAQEAYGWGEALRAAGDKLANLNLDTTRDKLHDWGDAARDADAASRNAQGGIAGLGQALGALPPSKKISVDADTAPAEQTMQSWWDKWKSVIASAPSPTPGSGIPSLTDDTSRPVIHPTDRPPASRSGASPIPSLLDPTRPPLKATGGAIFGAGTATSDSIPAYLSNGEHVLTAKDVEALGGQGGVYAFRQALHRGGGGSIFPMAQIPWPPGKINKTGDRAGNLPNLDSGFNPSQRALPWLLDPDSPIPSGPPGVPLPPTDDDILFPDSQPWWMRKWLEDHPPSSWKNPHRNMLLGAGLGFAGGGAVLPDGPGNYVVTPDNIMSAVEFAQSVNGKPYSYGGTGPLYDCSGFMSSIYGQVTGKPLPAGQRYFSTESDFSKLGFVKGFDADSPFNIGVHNGGGGKSSHMAGTLAGFNVESGSGGTLFGGAAAGANDPQFENKYHLPGSLTALASETGADVTKEYANSLGEGGQSAVKDLKDQGSQRSGPDGSSLGQSLVSGLLQGIGLDGSVFSNPLDWPNVKSGLALANWGGGLLKSAMGQEDSGAPDLTGGAGGGALSSIGLPSISGLLKPNAPTAAPAAKPYANVVVNGNVGMDPRAFTQRVDAAQNQSWRRNMTAVRP